MDRASTWVRVVGTVVLLSVLVPSALASPLYQIQIQVNATTPVYAGQTVTIAATVQLGNGTAVGNRVTFSAKLYYPNGTLVALSAPTVVSSALVRWTYALPANAPDGLYNVIVYASVTGANGTNGLGSFTVNSQIASKSGFTSITNQLTGLSTQLSTLTTNLAKLSTDMKGNFSAVISTISTDYTTLAGEISGVKTSLGTLSADIKGNFSALSSSVSSDISTLSSAMSNGFGGVRSSLGSLSTDLKGNFSSLSGAIQSVGNAVGTLATSASLAALQSNVTASFRNLNAGLSTLASSTQAGALKASLDSLTNQVTLNGNIMDFILLPIALFLLIILVFVFFRKPKQ